MMKKKVQSSDWFAKDTISSNLVEILVIGLMPFMSGVATRLPFIYFVIHLVQHFDFGWLSIGFYVALYQSTRVVASAFAIPFPRLSHFLGTAIGLAGYTIAYLADDGLVVPFVAGTAVVGFAENQSAIQKYVKEMYPSKPRQMLRYQYVFVMLGVLFSFLIGGYVYDKYKIKGVALFGMLNQTIALITFFAYLNLNVVSSLPSSNADDDVNGDEEEQTNTNDNYGTNKNEKKENTDDKKKNVEESCASTSTSMKEAGVGYDEQGRGGEHQNNEKTLSKITNSFNKSNSIPTTWINWLLCVSFGIQAITIGYQLSIGPIFILTQFEKDTSTIGLLFALGSALGNFLSIGSTSTSYGKRIMTKIAKSPFDICFAMGGIGIGSILATIPNFVCYVIGMLLILSFNDLATILLTELQASTTTISNYSMVGPMGQVTRRALNVVTALTGPILFGAYPSLPYIVACSITLSWMLLLFVAFVFRIKTSTKIINDAETGVDFEGMSFQKLEEIREIIKHDDRKVLDHEDNDEDKIEGTSSSDSGSSSSC